MPFYFQAAVGRSIQGSCRRAGLEILLDTLPLLNGSAFDRLTKTSKVKRSPDHVVLQYPKFEGLTAYINAPV